MRYTFKNIHERLLTRRIQLRGFKTFSWCVVNTPGFYGATIKYSRLKYAYYRQSREGEGENFIFLPLAMNASRNNGRETQMVLQFSESKLRRLLARTSSRIVTKLSETNSLVYEIFRKTSLYDSCLEILMKTRLEEILVGKLRLGIFIITHALMLSD